MSKPDCQVIFKDGTVYELTMEQARRAIAEALRSPNLPRDGDALARAARNANKPIGLSKLRDK